MTKYDDLGMQRDAFTVQITHLEDRKAQLRMELAAVDIEISKKHLGRNEITRQQMQAYREHRERRGVRE